MKAFTRLSATLVLVLSACGGSSSTNVTPSDTDSANPGALSMGKPFTVEDFKGAARSGKSVHGLSPDSMQRESVITLSNGYKTTLGAYLDQLNTLESGFNKLGMSLRKESSAPVLLKKTDIPVVTDDKVTLAPASIAPNFEQFTPFEWTKQLGSASSVGLILHAWVDANSGPSGVTTKIQTDVTALIMGQPLPLVTLTAESGLPVPLSALDHRYSTSGFGILGAVTPAGNYAAPQFDSNTTSSYNKKITPEPKVTFATLLGPIPLTMSLGIRGDVGVSAGAHTVQDTADAYVGPTIAARLFAEATAGVPFVNVTIEGEADLVRFTPSLHSEVSMLENGGQPTNVTWSMGFAGEVSALSGQITLTATIDLWILGKRSFTWLIASYPGVAFQVASSNQVHSLQRPALTPMPTVANHIDISPLFGTVGSGDRTFGGRCPNGAVRSECRTYPERDDVADCSSAHFVSADVTDCTCQFHVGSSFGNPVHCGADVWVTTPASNP